MIPLKCDTPSYLSGQNIVPKGVHVIGLPCTVLGIYHHTVMQMHAYDSLDVVFPTCKMNMTTFKLPHPATLFSHRHTTWSNPSQLTRVQPTSFISIHMGMISGAGTWPLDICPAQLIHNLHDFLNITDCTE